jgi:hypothetical protein
MSEQQETAHPRRTFFKHDMTPASEERRERKKTKKDKLEAAYEEVDKRDGLKCWVTGKSLQRSGVGPELLLTRHHLDERSTSPERRHDVTNIISVSLQAHRLITHGWLIVEGTDASKKHSIRFHWKADLDPKKRPFVIRSRRLSQQEDE